ncbi:MAG: GNAT family N-acetyltransferase [Actinomycetota bacterium]|nr:GNAT family N-acetyltransferase [Actinomycetota bacterium]
MNAAPLSVRAAAPTHLEAPRVDGLTWRPLARGDAPALAVLIQAGQEADGLDFRFSEAEAIEIFDAPALDAERDTIVGVDDDGALRAWTIVFTLSGDETLVRAVNDGGVHPEWRARGIGSQLVAWGTARARQLLAASGKDAPGRICQYLEESQRTAIALLAAAGYAPVRYYAELRRRLDDSVPETLRLPGVTIETWPAEDEEVRVAHNLAFADHWGSQPRSKEDWGSSRAMFAPRWSFVARDEATGRVIGYVKVDRYEHDWEIAGYSSGYVHLLGVLREWRGRGVAKALLAATMAAQRAEGIEFTELGVDTANPSGAQGLYAALGFEAFRTETLMSIEV